MSDVPAAIGLLEGMATTRAIRRYVEEPIPEEDLSQILWHATRAPTGSNRQQFRFLVLQQGPRAQEARRILGQSFRDGWAQKRAGEGYDKGSGQQANSPKARMANAMQHFVDHFEATPAIVLACYERHRQANPYEGASIYPAVQNLLLAARALGYGGVMTIWHAFVEDQLRPVLGIPDDIAIGATIAMGKPLGHHGPVRRRPVGELVFEDGWGEPADWAVDPKGTQFTSAGPPKDVVYRTSDDA